MVSGAEILNPLLHDGYLWVPDGYLWVRLRVFMGSEKVGSRYRTGFSRIDLWFLMGIYGFSYG